MRVPVRSSGVLTPRMRNLRKGGVIRSRLCASAKNGNTWSGTRHPLLAFERGRRVAGDLGERTCERGKPEVESQRRGRLRKDALAFEQHRGHLAERDPERQRRYRKQRRPRQDTREGCAEVRIGRRVGRDGVHHAPNVGALEREREQRHEIVEMDPARPLLPAADAAAEAETEDRQHTGERAAAAPEHHPDPGDDDADVVGFGCERRAFPVLTHLGEKSGAGLRLLGQYRVATIAVVPDGRRRQQDARAPCGRQCRDRPHEQPRPRDTRPPDDLLPPRRPARVGDAGTGEVHDGVDAVERAVLDRALLGIPDREPAAHGQDPRGLFPATRQGHDTVTRGDELSDQTLPDESRGSGHGDGHARSIPPESAAAHAPRARARRTRALVSVAAMWHPQLPTHAETSCSSASPVPLEPALASRSRPASASSSAFTFRTGRSWSTSSDRS